MMRNMLKSKIHGATITDANVEYEGSVTIDANLMEAADISPYEEVHIWNLGNGERLVTYAITGERGSGVMCANGAAARRVKQGDKVIVSTYGVYHNEEELKGFKPHLIFVDHRNQIIPKP